MSVTKSISFIHEKLGSLNIPTNPEGRPVYNRAIVEQIFQLSLLLLKTEKLISGSEYGRLIDMIKASEIATIDNLGSRISYQYQYRSLSGSAYPLAIFVDRMNEWLHVEDTVDALNDILCQVVASVLHPEDNIDDSADTKGYRWAKYASALLSEDRLQHDLLHGRLYVFAMKYLKGSVSGQLRELFEQEVGGDWEDSLAEEYANDGVSELDAIGTSDPSLFMPMADFIDSKIEEYEWDISLS